MFPSSWTKASIAYTGTDDFSPMEPANCQLSNDELHCGFYSYFEQDTISTSTGDEDVQNLARDTRHFSTMLLIMRAQHTRI